MHSPEEFIETYKPVVEKALAEAVSYRGPYDGRVWEAMEYSLLAGGKRLRPLLLLLAAFAVKGSYDEETLQCALPFACALEMIHTYSLIHDDLPAMDNDDLRRGKPTNHVLYGSGIATLAGDGLLNLAFETMLDAIEADPAPGRIRAAAAIAHAAGPHGMIAGQTADLLAEQKQEITEEHIQFIEHNKTGQLLAVSLAAGCDLAGGSSVMRQTLEDAGFLFGRAFQIRDDILDATGSAEELGKSTGQDEANGKATFFSLYGLEESRRQVRELSGQAAELVGTVPGAPAALLREWILRLINRNR